MLRAIGALALVVFGALLLVALPSATGKWGQKSVAPVPSASAQRAVAASAVQTYLRRGKGERVDVRGVLSVSEIGHRYGKGRLVREGAHRHERRYELLLEDNQVVQVAVTRATAPKLSAFTTGQIVVASGTQHKDEPLVLSTIDAEGELPPAGLGPITADTATQRGPTVRKALVIPVVYANEAGTFGSFDMAAIGAQLAPAKALMEKTSTGHGGLGASPTTPVAGDVSFDFTIRPTAVALGGPRPPATEQCLDNPSMNEASVNAAAGIDPLSVQYGQYDHYLYLYECARGNTPAMGDAPGPVSRYWYSGTAGAAISWYPSVFAHELTHNLGVDHDDLQICTGAGAIPSPSSAGPCAEAEYRGGMDYMGDGVGGTLLNAFHRLKLGFLPAQNSRQVTPAENQPATLISATTRSGPNAKQVIQVPRPKALAAGDPRGYYYLATRTASAPWDDLAAASPLRSGVSILKATGLTDLPTDTLAVQTHPFADLAPSGEPTHAVGETRFERSYSLAAGRSFYDAVEDYTITTRSLSTASGFASVTVEPGPPRGPATSASIVGGRLIVRAGTGATVALNSVSIVADGADLVVADYGNVLTAGAGCSSVTGEVQVVRCTPTSANPVKAIDVLLGDGHDQASVAKSVTKPVTLDGGAGDDTLVAHGSGADVVRGGAGQDFLDPAGLGEDTVSFADLTTAVSLDQAGPSPWRAFNSLGDDEIARTSSASGAELVAFERLVGSSFSDTLRWLQGSQAKLVDGGPGADTIATAGSDDTILARDGVADAAIDCGSGTNSIDRDSSPADPSPSNCSVAAVTTTIVAGPAEGSSTNAASVAFAFRSYTGAPATEMFQCKVEQVSSAWLACGQNYVLQLTDGPKTLSVRSVNGSVTGATTVRNFAVDQTQPTVALGDKPTAQGATPQNTGYYSTFAFSSSEATGRFVCRLDDVESACQAPVSYPNLAEGAHTFAVRAADEGGNLSAWTPTHTWDVVRTLPVTKITGGPDGHTTSATPTFTFTSEGVAATSFECRIVPLNEGEKVLPSFEPCSGTTSHTAPPLADARYRFEVRGRNAAGGVDQTPETLEFDVLAAAGTATLSAGTLTVTAAPGRENRIEIRDGHSDTITIEDVVPLRAVGCLQVTVRRVTCPTRSKDPATGVWTPLLSSIVADSMDGPDRIDVDVPSTDGTIATVLRGGDGDDVLRGVGVFADRFEGGPGADTVTYSNTWPAVSVVLDTTAADGPATGPSNSRVDYVTADVETVVGGRGADALTSGATPVTIDGGPGSDTLTAGTADTRFRGSEGADLLVGGTGTDTADYGSEAVVAIRYDGPTKTVAKLPTSYESPVAPVTLATTPHIDTLGTSIEKISGSSGADQFHDGPWAENLDGGTGIDTFVMVPGGGNDQISGGPAGDVGDQVSYAAFSSAVRVVSAGASGPIGSTADTDQVDANVEVLTAGSGADELVGTLTTTGYNGNDGNDVVVLPAGTLKPPSTGDGGEGLDTLDMRAVTLPIDWKVTQLGPVRGLMVIGSSTTTPRSFERIRGGSGDDTLRVTATGIPSPALTFEGGTGADTLTGSQGPDLLQGGIGGDTITGGAGADQLQGGDGDDKIFAKDSTAETILCGLGSLGEATRDTTDTSNGCETLLN